MDGLFVNIGLILIIFLLKIWLFIYNIELKGFVLVIFVNIIIYVYFKWGICSIKIVCILEMMWYYFKLFILKLLLFWLCIELCYVMIFVLEGYE